ncbi:MAG: hypothetical protein QM774_07110 [Gordonia sp. (in: high G+C Gram-positive bacteria)]|uniref:hypothetical protein n=1 Tax=Gordonia sp. (in: high G+C Gram-positive bacteria) TaxID=84139 RepID=UPI0039E2BCFB
MTAPQRSPWRPSPWRRVADVAWAIVALAAFVAVYMLLVHTSPGQIVDDETMVRFSALTGHEHPTPGLLSRIQLPLLLAAGVILAIVCTARRSWLLFLHACVLVFGTTVLAIGLKNGLPRPAFGVGAPLNSFPSNTVAAFTATALALAAVAAPRYRRFVFRIGALVVIVVGVMVIALQWHRPSDVLGAILLAAAVAALTEAVLPVRELDPY